MARLQGAAAAMKHLSYCPVCHRHWYFLATHLWVAHRELVLMVIR